MTPNPEVDERVRALRKALAWETVGPAAKGTYEEAQISRAFRAIVTELGITQEDVWCLAVQSQMYGDPRTRGLVEKIHTALSVLFAAGGSE